MCILGSCLQVYIHTDSFKCPLGPRISAWRGMYYSIVHTYHTHGLDTYVLVDARWVEFQMMIAAQCHIWHGVSIPELKMSTNLKTLFKCSVQMYKKWCILQYTVVGTPCRRNSAEIEYRQTGRPLARWASLWEAAFESSRGPTTEIQKWSVTETANI